MRFRVEQQHPPKVDPPYLANPYSQRGGKTGSPGAENKKYSWTSITATVIPLSRWDP